MLKKFTAIGFDLGETLIYFDGTPLNWQSLYRPALQSIGINSGMYLTEAELSTAEQILVRYNTRINPRTKEVRAEAIFTEILSALYPETLTDAGTLNAIVNQFFAFFQQKIGTYSDTLPALDYLRQQGCRLGILTDVPYGMPIDLVRADLANSNILERMDALLTSVDVGWRKPETVGFRELMGNLDAMPSSTMFIGNEPKDIQGARNAGICAVFLDRDNTGADYGQDITIHSLADIL